MLAGLLPRPIEPGQFYNVNFPALTADALEPAIVFCPLDPNPLPLSYRHEADGHHTYDGIYFDRARATGADVDVCSPVASPSRKSVYFRKL